MVTPSEHQAEQPRWRREGLDEIWHGDKGSQFSLNDPDEVDDLVDQLNEYEDTVLRAGVLAEAPEMLRLVDWFLGASALQNMSHHDSTIRDAGRRANEWLRDEFNPWRQRLDALLASKTAGGA